MHPIKLKIKINIFNFSLLDLSFNIFLKINT